MSVEIIRKKPEAYPIEEVVLNSILSGWKVEASIAGDGWIFIGGWRIKGLMDEDNARGVNASPEDTLLFAEALKELALQQIVANA